MIPLLLLAFLFAGCKPEQTVSVNITHSNDQLKVGGSWKNPCQLMNSTKFIPKLAVVITTFPDGAPTLYRSHQNAEDAKKITGVECVAAARYDDSTSTTGERSENVTIAFTDDVSLIRIWNNDTSFHWSHSGYSCVSVTFGDGSAGSQTSRAYCQIAKGQYIAVTAGDVENDITGWLPARDTMNSALDSYKSNHGLKVVPTDIPVEGVKYPTTKHTGTAPKGSKADTQVAHVSDLYIFFGANCSWDDSYTAEDGAQVTATPDCHGSIFIYEDQYKAQASVPLLKSRSSFSGLYLVHDAQWAVVAPQDVAERIAKNYGLTIQRI